MSQQQAQNVQTRPDVAIVIPSYNRAHLLERAINSVLTQNFTNYEIIVVDDCSTDNTMQVLGGLTDPRITIIQHTENKGGGGARNTGIKKAKAPLISFLDSDDEFLPGKLKRQVATLQNNPDTDVSYTAFTRHIDGKDVGCFPNRAPSSNIYDDLLNGNFIDTPCAVVRKSALDAVDGFDERLPRYQDWDLFLRLARNGSKFQFEHEPLLRSHISPASISSNSPAKRDALNILFDKFKNDIQASPKRHANFLLKLAHASIELGDRKHGRDLIRTACKEHPSWAMPWVVLGLSHFPKLYKFAYQSRKASVDKAPKSA